MGQLWTQINNVSVYRQKQHKKPAKSGAKLLITAYNAKIISIRRYVKYTHIFNITSPLSVRIVCYYRNRFDLSKSKQINNEPTMNSLMSAIFLTWIAVGK